MKDCIRSVHLNLPSITLGAKATGSTSYRYIIPDRYTIITGSIVHTGIPAFSFHALGISAPNNGISTITAHLYNTVDAVQSGSPQVDLLLVRLFPF